MRVITLATMLLLMGCFSASLAQQTGLTENKLTALPESVLNAEIKSARGPSFRLSDFPGKVLILNFWATWETPSRMEAPLLVDLQKHYWSRGVRVIGLNTENVDESRAEVRRWLDLYHPQYKIGWAPAIMMAELLQKPDVLPQTYVVSPTGHIVRRFIGVDPQKMETNFKAAIEDALKDQPAAVPAP